MTDEEKIEMYEKLYAKNNNASCFAIICSFIMPIVGVICYFVQRDRVENPNSYLHAAFWGFLIGIIYAYAQ